MTERERFDLIDRYFKGELSDEEVEQFNAEWASDEEFAEEVANHQKVNEVIIDAGLVNVKHKLQSIHNQHAYTNKNGKWVKGGIIGSAIGVIGLVIGGWLYLGQNNEADKTLPADNAKVNTEKPPEGDINKESADTDPSKDAKTITDKEEESVNNNQEQLNNKEPKKAYSDKKAEKSKAGLKEADDSQRSHGLTKVKNKATNDNPLSEVQAKDQQELAKTNAIDSDTIDLGLKSKRKSESSSPCKDFTISASYRLVKSCYEKDQGAIIIDTNSITGGQPPYQFSLSSDKHYKEEPRFSNLARGNYNVYIKDDQNCKDALNNLYVAGKDCSKTNYTFAPEREESWEYPFDKQANGTLIIYNKDGEKVYQSEVRNGTPSKWRGRDNNGKRLPMGLYLVTLKKSGNVTKTWNVSLVR